MQIKAVQEQSITVSRYSDLAIPSGGLTTSMVAVTTDVVRNGRPVVGFGYSSIGRFAQGGLIRERFAPRLLRAATEDLCNQELTNLDPLRAWAVMMAGEKPGGHGERCVAVGTLDMAIWDAAAKIADLPLFHFIADQLGRARSRQSTVKVYAAGGYLYPRSDLAKLSDEVRLFSDLGFTHAKIKIGQSSVLDDRRRIDAAARQLAGNGFLAVDAMNVCDPLQALELAGSLRSHALWWLEDICDPLDFSTQTAVASIYPGALGAGEALFSLPEAKLLHLHGGLRADRDKLIFDPVHCYGLPGYVQIVDHLVGRGWEPASFWPHGGHLYSLHVCAALGLGGVEISTVAFSPFCGLPEGACVSAGRAALPVHPGVGFETHGAANAAFQRVLKG